METHPKNQSTVSGKHATQVNGEYTVLVSLQNIDLIKTLLPPAIRAAKRQDGKIILLNVIEIPYQLPPSEAKQFILEREFKLEYARQVIETAGCDVEIMIRIAHRITYAIKHLSKDENVNIIIQECNLDAQTDTMFKRLKKRIKSWF